MKEQIIQWAKSRDLLTADNAGKQALKLTEEVGELASAILKNNEEKIIDAIGDIQVVLIILAAQLNLNYDKCLEIAYEEIKNRKGKTVNGTFIKESEYQSFE
jgi:NTP pyrophosphatase (non-canonical NTP hydrolase)